MRQGVPALALILVVTNILFLWIIDGAASDWGRDGRFMSLNELYTVAVWGSIFISIIMWLCIYLLTMELNEQEKFIEKKWGFDEW